MNELSELGAPMTVILEITKLDILKLILPAVISFAVGILIAPAVNRLMAKFDLRKHKSVVRSIDGRPATLTQKLHNDENKVLYRMGGLVVFLGLMASLAVFRILPVIFQDDNIAKLNFLSGAQTWLPLVALITGTIVGALDDLIVCGRLQAIGRAVGGGLSLKLRLGITLLLGAACAWWMVDKLDMNSFYIPFFGTYEVAWWLFGAAVIFAIVVTYAGGVIDGVDGLSGGVFSIMYSTMGLLAFLQQRFDLAALCFAVVGAILAFLWFNIPPARFMLSDIGSMPLTVMLAIIAVLTDALFVLPIISLPLVVSIGSVVLQLLSKKFRNGKKIFLVSPLHNHLQLKGWPAYKVTMRYWVLTAMVCSVGFAVFVLGGYFS